MASSALAQRWPIAVAIATAIGCINALGQSTDLVDVIKTGDATTTVVLQARSVATGKCRDRDETLVLSGAERYEVPNIESTGNCDWMAVLRPDAAIAYMFPNFSRSADERSGGVV